MVVNAGQWCGSREKSIENSDKKMNINQMIKSYLRIGQHLGSCLRTVATCTVLCLSMQGCDQESEPFVQEDPEPVPISMNATSVAGMETTRALIEGDAQLQAAGFKLYGYVTDGTNSAQVFNGQEVVYAGDVWDYTPKRYWLRDVVYYFGAYAPAGLSGIVKSSGHSLVFTIPNWQVADEAVDLIVATSSGSAADYVSKHRGVVDLKFNHVLACLEVQLKKKDDSGNSYKLKGLTYKNVPTSDGTTTYTLDYESSGNSQMGTPVLENMTVYNGAQLPVGTGSEGSPAVTFSHLLVPFTGRNNVAVSVTYIAGIDSEGSFKPSFEYTSEITTSLAEIQAGKRYILTLTFTGGENIEPELEIADWSIAKWNDEDIEEDPKYNW